MVSCFHVGVRGGLGGVLCIQGSEVYFVFMYMLVGALLLSSLPLFFWVYSIYTYGLGIENS